MRDTYSTSGNKLGSLAKAQEITRTGIGIGDADGWSRVVFQGQEAYVSSDYLSATKPQISKPSTSTGGSSSGQTSKPSTGGNTAGGGSSSGDLDSLGDELNQHRQENGGVGATTGPLTEEDYDWISGNITLG